MSVTTGRITAVEVVRAGATLDGDHATGAMSLDVLYGWDFSENGGSLSIDGEVYEYTSATFPTDSDEDPTVLVLGSALVADVDDGTFIAVDPEATDKMAHVDTGNGGGPVFARVHQSLIDSIAEGIRPANAQENVHIDDSTGWWVVTDVIGVALTRDPSYLDSAIELPAQMIPSESWTNFAHLYGNEVVFDRLQGDIAVMDTLTIARYASGEEGETTPASDSNVIELSSQSGIDVRTPTGETDDEGEPLYDHLLTVPTQARDANGEQIALVLQGNAFLKKASAASLTLDGVAADGEVSQVQPGAAVELANVVGDPVAPPTTTFSAYARNWPNLTSGANEIGWGIHNGFVVQARHNVSGANLLQARFINPDTGLLDHTVDLTNFANVAGFTAGGGYLYVLGKFTSSADWTITRWSPSGTNTSVFKGATVSSPANVCLGFDGGKVLLLDVGTEKVYTYNVGLDYQGSTPISGIGDATRASGVGSDWIALGNEFCWLTGTSSFTAERANTNSPSSRGWWSYCGRMTGAGQLPSGQFAATNQSGNVFTYNDAKTNSSSTLWAGWTKLQSSTAKESLLSPTAPVTWPARTYATIEVPGGTGAGYDAVQIYASSSSETSMWRLNKPPSQTQVRIGAAPTSGTHPPTTSGFGDTTSGDPAEIRSQAKDSNGDPVVKITGNYGGGEGLRPVGEITMYTGASAPNGWLICDGSSFSAATYPKLYAHLGSTTLPDLRSRFPVGAGTYTALRGTEGVAESNRSPRHDHASGSLVTGAAQGTVNREPRTSGSDNAAGTGHTHNVTGRTGFNLGVGADGDSQFPRYGVHYIIRAN